MDQGANSDQNSDDPPASEGSGMATETETETTITGAGGRGDELGVGGWIVSKRKH